MNRYCVYLLSQSVTATPRDMPGSVICVVTNHDELGTSGNKTGWYLPEVAHPFEVLTKAGYDITFVSPKGGKAPMVSTRCCQIKHKEIENVLYMNPNSKKKRYMIIS